MAVQTRTCRYDFRGAHAVSEVDSGGVDPRFPFVKKTTATGGTPTVAGIDGGGIRLQLDPTDEVQNLCVFLGDVLAFQISEIISIDIIARTVALLDTNTQLAFGLASSRNDDIDAITEAALFRCIGSNDIVLETDDGATDIDDLSTGFTLAGVWKRHQISFASRVSTNEPPSLSTGRGSNLEFYATNGYGSSRRVASGKRFNMSNYTGGLQPFVQIQKSSGTSTDYLDVLEVGIEVNLPA